MWEKSFGDREDSPYAYKHTQNSMDMPSVILRKKVVAIPCLSRDTLASSRVCLTLHVNSFGSAAVRRFFVPRILDPVCFLSTCPPLRC
jgi:hypothetical protein